jgi:glyceraldehyde-3-phosphate dehydrogenase type I
MASGSNKLFIAGFGGRIFSCILRALANQEALDKLVGVSASGPKDLSEMAEKLDHDSTHRAFPFRVGYINGNTPLAEQYKDCFGFLTFFDKANDQSYVVPVFGQPDPEKLPLKELGVDVAIDATGKFLTKELAQGFLNAGAKKVIMTAPAKDDTPLIIYRINGHKDTGFPIVSLASCTTNCAAPIVHALSEFLCMPKTVFLNTTHAVTNSQKMLDGNNKKLANSYAGLNNIVVTDTGATKSLQKIFPEIKKATGISCRVPVADGSILSLVMEFDEEDLDKNPLKNKLSTESVLAALKLFAEEKYSDLLKISDRKTMISTYVIGRPETSIVDQNHIEVIGNMVRIVAGYDNEYAYSYHAAKSAVNCPLPQ